MYVRQSCASRAIRLVARDEGRVTGFDHSLTAPALLAAASAVCYAAGLVLTQRGLRHRTPLAGAAISVPTAAALFWLLAPLVLRAADWRGDAALIFAAVGVIFPAAATLLTFEANRRLGPAVTGAVGNLSPLFAVLIAILALGELPGPLRLAGLAVLIGGVMLIAWPRGGVTARRLALLALALPLTVALLRGIAQPAVKAGLALWPSPFAAGLIGYTASAVTVLLVARYFAPAAAGAGRAATGYGWFMAVGLSNGGAVLLMYAALASGPVALVAPLVATYPLFTLGLARLLLPGQRIGSPVVAGILLTVAGVALLLAG